MTTIAATRTEIAADTLVTFDGQGVARIEKLRRIGDAIAGAAGNAGDCTRLLDWAAGGFSEKGRPDFSCPHGDDDEAILLILSPRGLFLMSASDPHPERLTNKFYAVGSGGKLAIGALAMGASIKRAMRIAAAHDPYTRGPFTRMSLR